MNAIYFMYITGYNSIFVSLYNETIANNNNSDFGLDEMRILS
ncbi:MAG TPA: hypothetical protein VLA74_11165 [Nitrososphaeraceae archaeon]|nr:hypothetical protein [Nitrososphaeraceae archaeon]